MHNNRQSGKTLAIIAYITLIGALIAFLTNQNKKHPIVSFHIRQSFGLWLTYFIFGYIVSSFNSWIITYSFWIFFSVLFIYGIYGAIVGKAYTIPLLGNLFQKLFKNI